MNRVTLCVPRHRYAALSNRLPLTAYSAVCSINNKYYRGDATYIRAVNIERDGERYGTYFQAVRSYREQGKVKQEVIHLGEHQTADETLTSWEQEIEGLQTIRPKQARKLQAKLDRLKVLMD